MPAWVSPWGLAALMLGTAALLAASLIGERLVTLLLSAGGLTAVVLGRRATGAERTSSDGVWLALAGALSGLVLVLTIFSPGVLNNRWAIDFAVPQVDPDEQVVVPLNKPRDQGTVLTADDWVDASKDAIRQDDLLLNVESVQVGPLEDKGPGAYGAVHIRFANIGSGTINFQGFDRDMNLPVLTDTSGSSYAFVEQRQRTPASGEVVFGPPKRGGMALSPTKHQGYLLVFESAPSGPKAMKMELPASAWGRKGRYQFLISRPF
ncbi:MAG TPA: hypothetical protein VNX28_09315 [Gemmataceae bacterium]|jgi:hypothetical protein|nr:hypothetical protein [Gemmataceae bacterium]